MEQQKQKTIIQTGDDTITVNGTTFYTPKAFKSHMGFSQASLGTPYAHVRTGKAELFKFFRLSFFRPI